MSLGPLEVMVILVIALMLFGPDRLPEMGRTVAKGMKELRKLQDSVKADIDQVMHEAGLKDEAPTYRAKPASDDDHDHEAAPFPVDPDAPTDTADVASAEPFPVDTGYDTESSSPSASSTNGHSVPKPRTGPLDSTQEIVDIGDGFPPSSSFS